MRTIDRNVGEYLESDVAFALAVSHCEGIGGKRAFKNMTRDEKIMDPLAAIDVGHEILNRIGLANEFAFFKVLSLADIFLLTEICHAADNPGV